MTLVLSWVCTSYTYNKQYLGDIAYSVTATFSFKNCFVPHGNLKTIKLVINGYEPGKLIKVKNNIN